MAKVSEISIKRISALLAMNDVRQKDLASLLCVSEPTVSQKMNGSVSFTLRDMSRIADYFDVSLDYLTGRSDYAKPLEVA